MSSRRKRPRELTEGLKPIRIGLLRADYDEAYRRAVADREAELSQKLEALREWYGVAPGPDCWRGLCLAMAAERFPGFRVKAGRKPLKWTMGTYVALAGEMRRAMEEGAATQEEAAQVLAAREPWASFLVRGRWNGKAKPRDRDAWQNLLAEYTHMPPHYRATGEAAYQGHVLAGTLAEWDRQVRDFIERPSPEEK